MNNNTKDTYTIGDIFYIRVKIEPYKNSGPAQCFNCNQAPHCVKYGKEYPTKECPRLTKPHAATVAVSILLITVVALTILITTYQNYTKPSSHIHIQSQSKFYHHAPFASTKPVPSNNLLILLRRRQNKLTISRLTHSLSDSNTGNY